MALNRGHEYKWELIDPDGARNIYSVQSKTHPTANARTVFRHGPKRCNCDNRVKHLEMCVHEICCFGFRLEMFEERHLLRVRVECSTTGWQPPPMLSGEEATSGIEMFDFNEGSTFHTNERNSRATTNLESVNLVNPFEAAIDDIGLPVDYLPSNNQATKPFTKQEIESLFNECTVGYNHFSTGKQYAVSKLLLQMQELMTDYDSEDNYHVQGSVDLSIHAPRSRKLSTEPRKRLKPARDQFKKTNKLSNLPGNKRK